MKILIALDEFSLTAEGGSQIVVQRLVRGLSQGHRVAILTSHRRGQDFKKTAGKITCYSLNINYPSRFRAWLSLYNPQVSPRIEEVLADFKPDVVNAHTIHMYLTYDLLRVARHYARKVIFTGHDVMPVLYNRLTRFLDCNGDGIPDQVDTKVRFWEQWWENKLHFFPLRNLIIRHYLNQVEVITVSKALKALYISVGIRVAKVIHNGIDLNQWKSDPEKVNQFRKKYQLENRRVLFLGGRIREDKGSLQAVKLLSKLGGQFVFLVAGAKNSVSPMLSLADTLQVKKRVIPLGFLAQEQLKIAYFASDLIVVPSICFDSFPNAVIEGMASRRVVMATCFGGAKEAISDGESGILMNPFDVEGAVEKIREVMQGRRQKTMAQRAYNEVKEKFTLQRQLRAYLKLFND